MRWRGGGVSVSARALVVLASRLPDLTLTSMRLVISLNITDCVLPIPISLTLSHFFFGMTGISTLQVALYYSRTRATSTAKG